MRLDEDAVRSVGDAACTRLIMLGGSCAEELAEPDRRLICMEAAAGPVIVDLSGLAVTDPPAVRRLAIDVAGAASAVDGWCFTTGRMTSRLLLLRAGVGSIAAVFLTVQDALQARVLRDAGYGPGWAPVPTVPVSQVVERAR